MDKSKRTSDKSKPRTDKSKQNSDKSKPRMDSSKWSSDKSKPSSDSSKLSSDNSKWSSDKSKRRTGWGKFLAAAGTTAACCGYAKAENLQPSLPTRRSAS